LLLEKLLAALTRNAGLLYFGIFSVLSVFHVALDEKSSNGSIMAVDVRWNDEFDVKPGFRLL